MYCDRPRYSNGSTLPALDDIPPIFGGEVVEKIDLYAPSPEEQVGRIVVGVMSSVDDVSALMDKVHDGLDRFKRGGVRKIWVYRALDDGREVMILQEIDNEINARHWIDHPDAAAEWMSNAGLGAYPTQFVGKFAHLMSIERAGRKTDVRLPVHRSHQPRGERRRCQGRHDIQGSRGRLRGGLRVRAVQAHRAGDHRGALRQ